MDAVALYHLTVKALRSYVPHFPPALVSVRDVMEIIDGFSEKHPSLGGHPKPASRGHLKTGQLKT